ncbi:MAG: DedA family protein [Thermoplasmata archaeon]|nr:DedA family protein [Thermoplasmata archaeon]
MSFSLVTFVIDLIITILTTVGLTGLFALMTVESFGVPPLPSEIILPFAGFLVATGVFPLVPTVVVALAGGLTGAFIAYAVGRWWRDRIVHLGIGPIRLEERHLARMDVWFARHGEVTVALARCVPVVRAYISYPAGTARMPPVRFGVYTVLGSVPFTLALVYAGYVLGSKWTEVEQYLRPLDYVVYAILAVGAIYLVVLVLRGRRKSVPKAGPGDAPPGPPPSAPDPPTILP